jgi:tetratricopeptide (TPR) repeat protein
VARKNSGQKGRLPSKSKPVRVRNPERVRILSDQISIALNAQSYTQALPLLIELDSLVPGNYSILFNCGYVCQQLGELKTAQAYLLKCTNLQPDNGDGWLSQATVQRDLGDIVESIESYKKVLQLQPHNVPALNDLANQLVLANQSNEAYPYYQRVLTLQPDNINFRLNFAECLETMGRIDEAIEVFQSVIGTDKFNIRTLEALANCFDALNQVAQAEVILKQLTELIENSDYLNQLGNVQVKQGKLQDAIGNYQRSLQLNSNRCDARNNLGLVLAAQGRRDEAENEFRQVLKQDPKFTEAWRNLSAMRKFSDQNDDDIRAMVHLSDASLQDSQRIHLDFALGKALDDCGEFDSAFGYFASANNLRNQSTPFDLPGLTSHADRIRTVFSKKFLEMRKDWSDSTGQPLFIVGMPRSGTTLLEQILSSHDDVHGGGELLLINQTLQKLEAGNVSSGAYPECVLKLIAAGINDLALQYQSELEIITPSARYVSDKMPYNFFHLGLVHLLFPSAKIIQCLRTPLDICLSAYFNYFPRGLDFTYSIENLVGMYSIYKELMDHWRDNCGINIHKLSYESLVGDPGETIESVVNFLGLDYDSSMLQFFEQERTVQTLSSWQVRRPLYQHSRARWRNYADHIALLEHALLEKGIDPYFAE